MLYLVGVPKLLGFSTKFLMQNKVSIMLFCLFFFCVYYGRLYALQLETCLSSFVKDWLHFCSQVKSSNIAGITSIPWRRLKQDFRLYWIWWIFQLMSHYFLCFPEHLSGAQLQFARPQVSLRSLSVTSFLQSDSEGYIAIRKNQTTSLSFADSSSKTS